MKTWMIISLLLTIYSCKTQVLKEFPKTEPEILYTSLLIEERCFARCYDLQKAETVDPALCGVDVSDRIHEDLSWEEGFLTCDEISGFKTRAWAERLIPYLKEVSDWVYDNLSLIKSKIEKLLEE